MKMVTMTKYKQSKECVQYKFCPEGKTVMYEHNAELQMAAVALKGKYYAIDEDTKEKARQTNLELFKKYFKD